MKIIIKTIRDILIHMDKETGVTEPTIIEVIIEMENKVKVQINILIKLLIKLINR